MRTVCIVVPEMEDFMGFQQRFTPLWGQVSTGGPDDPDRYGGRELPNSLHARSGWNRQSNIKTPLGRSNFVLLDGGKEDTQSHHACRASSSGNAVWNARPPRASEARVAARGHA